MPDIGGPHTGPCLQLGRVIDTKDGMFTNLNDTITVVASSLVGRAIIGDLSGPNTRPQIGRDVLTGGGGNDFLYEGSLGPGGAFAGTVRIHCSGRTATITSGGRRGWQ